MLNHCVSTVEQNGQTKRWLWLFMFHTSKKECQARGLQSLDAMNTKEKDLSKLTKSGRVCLPCNTHTNIFMILTVTGELI